MATVYRLEAAARAQVLDRLASRLSGRTDLSFALVFGSFVNSDAFRDIDLAVWTTPDAPPDLDVDLAAALSRELGMTVDVRRINDAPVPFLFHALGGRIVADQDRALLATMMERIARAYHDLAPRLRQATREAFAR